MNREPGREALLVASPELLKRRGVPVQPSDLQRLPTVAMSAADGRAVWRLVGPQGKTFELQHQPVYTADDLPTLKFAALSGSGVALMPYFMVQDELREGVLQRVLLDWAPPLAQVYALFASRRGMLPAVRRLLDFLAEHAVDAESRWRNCGGSHLARP